MILNVKVERVAYPKEGMDGEWYILVTDQGTVKGKLSWRPLPEERLALNGKWDVYRGIKEFKFTEGWHDLPIGARNELRYACELTKGIGPALQDAIWEAKGEAWREVQAGEVRRLDGEVYNNFRMTIETLTREKEKADAVAWLMSKACTRNMGERAFETWKEKTISVVNGNPYRLAELPNYSFKDVDGGVRQAFGIGETDYRRVRAAVVYFMRQLTNGGGTSVAWWILEAKITQATGLVAEITSAVVTAMFEEGALIPFHDSHTMALREHYDNELTVWRFATGRAA